MEAGGRVYHFGKLLQHSENGKEQTSLNQRAHATMAPESNAEEARQGNRYGYLRKSSILPSEFGKLYWGSAKVPLR